MIYKQLQESKARYTAELAILNKRTSIVYEDEFNKCRLNAKLSIVNEILERVESVPSKKIYRVVYSDFIEADSEVDAVEIFNHTLDHLDASDENINVYEVDSHHNVMK